MSEDETIDADHQIALKHSKMTKSIVRRLVIPRIGNLFLNSQGCISRNSRTRSFLSSAQLRESTVRSAILWQTSWSRASYWGLSLLTTGVGGYAIGKWLDEKPVPAPNKTESQPQYANRQNMEEVCEELRIKASKYMWLMLNHFQAVKEIQSLLGEDGVSMDDEILLAHGYSEWSTINIDRLPVAVAFPTTTEEVSKIAKVCMQYKVPISKCFMTKFCLRNQN